LDKSGCFIYEKTSQSVTDFEALVLNLDENTKNQWLLRLLDGETLLDVKLKKSLAEGKNNSENEITVTFEQIKKKVK
jgi:hypothetical protein